jgi:hypothetical protein
MEEVSETATSIESIHLKSKLLELKTEDDIEILIDVQALLKAPAGSDEAYFKITDIAKKFGKEPKVFVNQLPSVQEYIEILKKEVKGGIIPPLKRGKDFIYTKRGKYHGGTWVHKELFLKFASWVSVQFERDMHRLVMKLLVYSDQLKIDRLDTKFLYKELGKTVKEIYLEKQSENGKRFAYQNLANLINLKVLGYTAKQYRELHDVDPNIAIRDTLPDETLEAIIEVEKDMNGYIKYGEIYDYDTLKKKILEK